MAVDREDPPIFRLFAGEGGSPTNFAVGVHDHRLYIRLWDDTGAMLYTMSTTESRKFWEALTPMVAELEKGTDQ